MTRTPLLIGALFACSEPLVLHDADARLGVIGPANLDDDDRDGLRDLEEAPLEDDDRVPLRITGPSRRWSLSLEGPARIYRDEALLLEDGQAIELRGHRGAPNLAVEWLEPGTTARLTVDDLEVPLTAAPLLLGHPLQPTEELFLLDLDTPRGNQAMVADFTRVLGDVVTLVDAQAYDGDRWLQDEIELASATWPGGRMDIVIDSIRDGLNTAGLDDFPEDELLGPGTGVGTWGSGADSSLDAFGNLETTPPLAVDGIDYPYGRVVYGTSERDGAPHADLLAMLDRQGLQAPFSLDMSWTCIQHVDELLAFIPAPEAPRGWLLVQPDPDAALTLLGELEGTRPLPLYEAAYGLPTVDALRSDPDVLAATAVARDAITRARETLRQELGLDDDDITRLPVLFRTSPLCGPGYLTALTPNLVNLASVTLEDGTTHLFLPDPHLGDDDPFVAASVAALPESAEVHIVDDWEAYHLGEGEVHCATNLRRTPTGAPWWTSDE